MTSPLYSIPEAITIGTPDLSSSSILFHGVNKSGSLAMAEVLRAGYQINGRTQEYMCRYFGIPKNRQEAENIFQSNLGKSQILIDHNLVGLVNNFPEAKFITLLRNPVKRLVSCFYWLKKYHPKSVADRSLLEWAKISGHSYSLSFQFACFAGTTDHVKIQTKALPISLMAEKGRKWFENNISLYGISEHFEESIILFASALGLREITSWQPDVRNTTRPKWDYLDDDIYHQLEKILDYDCEFYNEMHSQFLVRTVLLNQLPSVQQYIFECSESRDTQKSYGSESVEVLPSESSSSIPTVLSNHVGEETTAINNQILKFQIPNPISLNLGDLSLITENLPHWWLDGGNRLFVDPKKPLKKLPNFTHPATKPPPRNCTMIVRCETSPAVQLWGNDCVVILCEQVSVPQGRITCGDGSLIYLGSRVRSNGSINFDVRNGGTIYLEGDCLLKDGCRIVTDETHTIRDVNNQKRINPFGGTIFIRKHVLLSRETIIMGNSDIKENCFVMARAVVQGNFSEQSLIGGVPATVLKENITWDVKDLPNEV